MTQYSHGTIVASATSGSTLASMLNQRDAAENSGHSGTSRPSYATPGMVWMNTTFTPPHVMMWDGSSDIDLTNAFSDRPGSLRYTSEVLLPAGWLWADGSAQSRTTFAALFAAICPSFTATLTNGSATISAIATDFRNLGLIGARIEGPAGMPVGGTVTAITANTMTLSAAFTGSTGSATVRLLPWGVGNGSTTFNVPDARGRTLVGRDDLGGTLANRLTVAGSSIDGTKLNQGVGSQNRQLVEGNLPPHSHSASSSGTASVTVAGAGTHVHGRGTLAVDLGGSHSHTYVRSSVNSFTGGTDINKDWNTDGAGKHFEGTIATSTHNGHTHTISGQVGVAGTGAADGSHTHTASATLALITTIGNGNGTSAAFAIVQPSLTCNVIIKT